MIFSRDTQEQDRPEGWSCQNNVRYVPKNIDDNNIDNNIDNNSFFFFFFFFWGGS